MVDPALRRAVIAAHGYRCVYCNAKANSADHILPTALGGEESPRNLVAACQPCNSTKGRKRLPLILESELRMLAWVAEPLVTQIVAAESAASARKRVIDLTTLPPI
jgi:hypothetical protein